MNAKVKWTAAECLKVINDAANESRHRGEYGRANSLVNARARLASILREQAVSVPSGWKLAPVEPTPRMLTAGAIMSHEDMKHDGTGHGFRTELCRREYKAMLASAPTAPAGDICPACGAEYGCPCLGHGDCPRAHAGDGEDHA